MEHYGICLDISRSSECGYLETENFICIVTFFLSLIKFVIQETYLEPITYIISKKVLSIFHPILSLQIFLSFHLEFL